MGDFDGNFGNNHSDYSSRRGGYEPGNSFDSNGEYHFVRPEHNLYEDANYVPCSEDTDVPKYYMPSEKAPKEPKPPRKRNGFGRTVCLCLVCAILGGLGGGFIFSALNRESAVTPATSPDASPNTEQTAIIRNYNTAAEPGDSGSIYSLGCSQAVGIKTEVTTKNWFGQTSTSAVSGSGFVVTEDGYILTNYHVIEYAYNYNLDATVMFYEGKSYTAKIVGVEPSNDVAVLKIDASGLNPVTVGDSDAITVGEEVYAIGNPLGELAFSMTTGHVSALNRTIRTDSGTSAINMFQFDAAVNSGNSGGPLYDANGCVIGIVTAKYSSTGVEGLSFAIPINDAVDIANELIANGYVSNKAYLGVSIDNNYTSVYAEYYNMPVGAYVYSVEKGSCSEKAGIRAGDIITKIGDTDITCYTDLNSAVRRYKAGETAEITVYRSNKYITMKVTFDEVKQAATKSGYSDYRQYAA